MPNPFDWTGIPQAMNDIGKGLGFVPQNVATPGAVAHSNAANPGMNFGTSDEDRKNQMLLMQQLQAQANGTGPSVAQGQLQQATDNNVANAYALSQAQPGNAANARNVANNAANINQQSAGQSAILRNQEMLQGQNSLMAMLGGMRGQDQGQTGSVAGQQFGYDQMNANQNFNYDQMNANRQLSYDQLNSNIDQAAIGRTDAAISGVGQGVANIATGGMWGGAQKKFRGGPVDSPSNDTVPAMLSPGEIVLPRSVAQDPEADDKAAKFVQHVKGMSAKTKGADAHMKKIAALEKRVKQLEKAA